MASDNPVYLTLTAESSYVFQEAQARGVELMFEFELFKLADLWRAAARSQSQDSLNAAMAFEAKLLEQIKSTPSKLAARPAQP